jgi:hypothetical protein
VLTGVYNKASTWLILLNINAAATTVTASTDSHHIAPCRMIWAYWISPFAWGLRCFAINELTTPKWQVSEWGAA